ncbi:serine/threonine protein phosphatase [Geomonas sp. RF6]|uniref:metallophosphoesterase family protein n=1 Tax=Geomonas sp. RF6 TaxID=2897342 RepID=UPI001E5F6A34|nr:metallophosphoesterase family protein [Geomonas sp. RF6]UFS69429.1 serine/threonine protein phosphatase [Geomonas sp. RF6]
MAGGRQIVVGDIHGCSRTFEALLARVDLQRDDTLFLLGDYIDRGSSTRGLIESIVRMKRDGFDVRPIRGNHEEMLLGALETGLADDLIDWMEQGGHATLRSYGVRHPSEMPEQHLHFLRRLPLFIITDRFVFVHAGLDFSLPDPFSEAGTTAMLWDRSGKGDQRRLGGRRIVTGHTPLSLDEIRSTLNSDKIRLDNGCVLGARYPGLGNLLALDLDSGELFVQRNVDRL